MFNWLYNNEKEEFIMTLGEVIKQYRIENRISMDDFAKVSGLSKGYISMLEKNKNPKTGNPITPSIDTYKNVAKGMHISIEELMNITTNADVALVHDERNFFDETTLPGYIPISKRKIPLLGTVAAGEPIFADENIEEYLPIDDTIHADFALHVKGNSMIGANIYDGDIVLVRKQNDVDDGQIGIVLKDDEATMKRVYHGKDHLTLIAENPDYPPIICSAETCSFCKILGLVTHVIHKFI